MEVDTTEWDAICRICLQEGQLFSIFDYEDESTDVTIAKKISMCSAIEVKPGGNLPEQICTYCLIDLGHAFKFRQNCERSNTILQSFVDQSAENETEGYTDDCDDNYVENDSTSESIGSGGASGGILVSQESTGSMYEYWPPSGLNVKLVRNEAKPKRESTTTTAAVSRKRPLGRDKLKQVKAEPIDIFDVDDEQEEHLDDTISDSELLLSDDYNDLNDNEPIMPRSHRLRSNGIARVTQIKHVKTNKARLGSIAATSTKSKSAAATTSAATNTTPNSARKQAKVTKRVDRPDTNRKMTISKEQKAPKTCPICGNTYKYQHALESHLRRHRNEKPFVCSVCDKGFVINFELTRHMRTHTGQKPYACNYCDRRFSDFGSRVKHQRTHTGERPYACQECGKTFTYSHVLSSHMLIHTGEKKYHCETCGKRFAKSHHLKAHMNTHNKATMHKTQHIKYEHPDEQQMQHQNESLQHEPVDLAEYINISRDDMVTEDESVDDIVEGLCTPIMVLSQVDVDTLQSQMERKIGDKTQYIEDENGIQHEITISDHQNAIELLTFDDEELE